MASKGKKEKEILSDGTLAPTPTEEVNLEATSSETELPAQTELVHELPKDYNESNSIQLGDEIREIKSTKLKYHRNNTSISYKIFQMFPLPDAVNMEKGYFDPNRSGDQILFDFLVAVFDDVEFVKRHYDDITSQDVDKILEIFCRVNGITERDEQAKNRAAKVTKA